MNQYISNKNDSILSLKPNELYQFNSVDTVLMNSNGSFILQPELQYNVIDTASGAAHGIMSEIEYKSPKEIIPLTLKDAEPKKYSCDLCNSIFDRAVELRMHKRSQHILSKIYKCPKCNDSFNFEYNYKIHLYSHLKTTKQCPECLQNFKRSTIFIKHLKIHQNSDCFECLKCKTKFEFKDYYDWHLNDNNKNRNCNNLTKLAKNKDLSKSDKNISKKHVCQICGKKFQKPFFLRRHENIHFNIKPFECQECFGKFNQKNSLDRHKLVHTKEKPYECPKCNMRFSQRSNLLLHDKNVHSASPNDTTKYPCPTCSCIFNKTNSLNRHISQKHKLLLNDGYSADNVMEQLNNFLNQQNSWNGNIDKNDKTKEKPEALQVNLIENITINKAITLESREENHENTESIIVKDDNKAVKKLVKVIDTLNPNKEITYKIVQQIIQNGIKWFGCNVCEKKFKLSYDLLRHLTVHTKERTFICGICSKAFALKNTLKCHLRIHSQEKRFHCTICFLKFHTLKQLNNHISEHGQIRLFVCQLCAKSFRTSHNLRVHQRIHRPKDKRIKIIEKTLVPPIKLNSDSIKSETLQKFDEKFQCLICGILLKSNSHLRFHEKQHLNLKKFECSICYKRFSTKSALNIHHKIHFTIRTMKCLLCPSKFRNSSDLKRHSVVHTTERKFLCPYCSKLFKTRSTCLAHIKLHAKDELEIFDQKDYTNENEQHQNKEYSLTLTTDNIDLNIPTDEINFKNNTELYIENSNISTHLPTINIDKTTIPNNLLGKEKFIDIQEFPKRENNGLKNNIIVEIIEKEAQSDNTLLNYAPASSLFDIKKKSNPKIFPCEYCRKIFKKPIDYRRHIRSHTKEKPFLCQICNKNFSLKCSLNNHLKLHDTNRQTYNCIVCNKKYASKSVLNTHIRLHTGEMPYQCELCLRKFRTLGHRNSHICQINKNV